MKRGGKHGDGTRREREEEHVDGALETNMWARLELIWTYR
jgi:hypothetical protein